MMFHQVRLLNLLLVESLRKTNSLVKLVFKIALKESIYSGQTNKVPESRIEGNINNNHRLLAKTRTKKMENQMELRRFEIHTMDQFDLIQKVRLK